MGPTNENTRDHVFSKVDYFADKKKPLANNDTVISQAESVPDLIYISRHYTRRSYNKKGRTGRITKGLAR